MIDDQKRRLVDSDPSDNAEAIERALRDSSRQSVNRQGLLLVVLLALLVGYGLYRLLV
jgi:hypothetical protein